MVVSDKPFIMRLHNDPNPRSLQPEQETENVAGQDFSQEETFNEEETFSEEELSEEQEKDTDEL